MAALHDRPRPGREPVITDEARTFVADLACRKAKNLGDPHELSTTRLLAKQVRAHGPAAGTPAWPRWRRALCKILAAHEVKPHKVRYCPERRDVDFGARMAEVLCVYREVALLKQSAVAAEGAPQRQGEQPGFRRLERRRRTRRLPLPGTSAWDAIMNMYAMER
jgi:hypothetical protein